MDVVRSVPAAHAEIVQIIEPLTAYVRSRARTGDEADDVVQETLTRILGLENAFTPDSGLAYAIVIARNLLTDGVRDATRARRLGHRVIDLTDSAEPVDPETEALRREERLALRAALAEVPADVRQSLLDHVLDDVPVTAIAYASGDSSGATGARLARTRAKLRLDYLLALRGTDLPTERCRPILLALSAGDTRRQNTLRAGSHLITCSTCSYLSEPLLQRRSALAAFLPWLGIGPALGLLRALSRRASDHPAVTASAAAVTVGTASVVLVMATTASGSAPVPPPVAARATTPATTSTAATTPAATAAATAPAAARGLVRVSDGANLLSTPIDLSSQLNQQVRATAVTVLAVPADEGFWVGADDQDRIWVQMRTAGQESRDKVKVGDEVTFTGEIVQNGKNFARDVGVSKAEGAALLTHEGAHISVEAADVKVSR